MRAKELLKESDKTPHPLEHYSSRTVAKKKGEDEYKPFAIPGLPATREYPAVDYDNQVVEFLHAKAQKWLKLTANGTVPAWRGAKMYQGAAGLYAFVKPTRQNRIPLGSPMAMHLAYNAMFKAMGCPANRSNSVFVSGDRDTAAFYGTPYVIFPMGEFTYVWSQKYDDLMNFRYEDLEKVLKPEAVERDENDNWMGNIADPNSYNVKALRTLFSVDKYLMSALGQTHEVMIKCDEAVYMPEWYYEDQIRPKLMKELTRVS